MENYKRITKDGYQLYTARNARRAEQAVLSIILMTLFFAALIYQLHAFGHWLDSWLFV